MFKRLVRKANIIKEQKETFKSIIQCCCEPYTLTDKLDSGWRYAGKYSNAQQVLKDIVTNCLGNADNNLQHIENVMVFDKQSLSTKIEDLRFVYRNKVKEILHKNRISGRELINYYITGDPNDNSAIATKDSPAERGNLHRFYFGIDNIDIQKTADNLSKYVDLFHIDDIWLCNLNGSGRIGDENNETMCDEIFNTLMPEVKSHQNINASCNNTFKRLIPM